MSISLPKTKTPVFRRWWALAAVLLAAVATGGCKEQKRTEIIVGLATDLMAPTPLAAVTSANVPSPRFRKRTFLLTPATKRSVNPSLS